MADKSVSELIAASQVNPGDLFVLEQDGTAKKLTGQVLENWLLQMANGHGGIHSVEKTGSNGLTDTYRMTFADTSTYDYVVTNGKGIQSIAKTKTSGLVDTYTVTFNDGNTFTYTVTNGAKGEKGDAWYVWFKYASQMPTDASHSIGDVIDNCIGVYSGTQATKPTDWKAYQWFQIKGDKGETGAPAILMAWKTEYQLSTSGKVPPSGNWIEEIPTARQGDYVWTRTIQTYNSGTPVVAYSVSYLGKDGTVTFEDLTQAQKDEIRGGYYTPSISQPNASTIQMSYTKSGDDMPSVDPVTINLPAGPKGDDGKNYVLTDADRTTIATMAQKNIPTPTESGDAAPKNYVDTVGLATAAHAKSGTVHTLTAPAGAKNLKFTATAPFADGDTIKLGGTAVTAKTQDGEPLSGGAWAAGAVVVCFLEGTTLFFRGGGGSKSQIIVTAPTGSTVTCSMGSVTKTAQEKNGTWTFKNCDLGTWTIKATLGGDVVTETVEISEEGHLFVYRVAVSYRTYPSDFNLTAYGAKGVDYEVVRDDDTVIAASDYKNFTDWNLLLLTGGTLAASKAVTIDLFVLGGGGACSVSSSNLDQRAYGGSIETQYRQKKNAGSYPIVIGAGGNASAAPGGNSSAFGITANGGISSSSNVAPVSAGVAAFDNGKSSRKYGGSLGTTGDAPANSGFGTYNGKKNAWYKGGSGIVIIREAR